MVPAPAPAPRATAAAPALPPSRRPMPQYLSDLETPALVVDLDVLAQNLDRMAAYCAMHGLQLRPHVKTHKAHRIAAEQLRLGATGLTCATPRELEVMSELADDLVLMHPPVSLPKLRRVMALPDHVRLTVGLDSVDALRRLSEAARAASRVVGVYVEADLGMHRIGVQHPEEALALAARAADDEWLRFRGLAFYPGHIRAPRHEQGPGLVRLGDDLAPFLETLVSGGMEPPVVSGGSTPAGFRMHEVPGITEVRPGTYVYNDRTTVGFDACAWEDCALTVLATVVSTSVPGQAVIDAGTKSLGREPLNRGDAGWGALLDHPEVIVGRMSEEHGVLDLSASSWKPHVGEQVRIVPNHVCIAVHLADTIYGARNEVVETSWPVDARGRQRPTREGALR